jgi:prophage maintenance system killer protein
MITKKDIITINKQFDDGKIVNHNPLDFALSSSKTTKDWIKSSAYILRAILVDHVFEEGNKRTASAFLMSIMEKMKVAYDPHKVDKLIVEIILKNITNINKIRRMIKDATR